MKNRTFHKYVKVKGARRQGFLKARRMENFLLQRCFKHIITGYAFRHPVDSELYLSRAGRWVRQGDALVFASIVEAVEWSARRVQDQEYELIEVQAIRSRA